MQLKTKDKFAPVYGILHLWFSITFKPFLIPHKVKFLQIHMKLNKVKNVLYNFFTLLLKYQCWTKGQSSMAVAEYLRPKAEVFQGRTFGYGRW